MKITIKGIELEFEGKTVTLTLEEARQLHRELGEFFLKEPATIPVPLPYPVPIWPDPVPVYPVPLNPWPPLITYGDPVLAPTQLPYTICSTGKS